MPVSAADVDDAGDQVGNPLPQQLRGGEHLHRRHIADTSQNHVGPGTRVIHLGTRPVPHRTSPLTVRRSLVGRQILQVWLLVGDDEVHVIAAAEAVIGDGQQAVSVRRQPGAYHPGTERDDGVQQPGPLVAEAVVVVTPAGGS